MGRAGGAGEDGSKRGGPREPCAAGERGRGEGAGGAGRDAVVASRPVSLPVLGAYAAGSFAGFPDPAPVGLRVTHRLASIDATSTVPTTARAAPTGIL